MAPLLTLQPSLFSQMHCCGKSSGQHSICPRRGQIKDSGEAETILAGATREGFIKVSASEAAWECAMGRPVWTWEWLPIPTSDQQFQPTDEWQGPDLH